MATKIPRLVVCGGNGFLGSRICKSAASRGWAVTSVSRSGEPDWNTAFGSSTPPEWSKKVTWARANLLSPSTYRGYLKDATAVVHTMGILLEADYKGALSGKENPITGIRKAFDSAKGTSRNPLKENNSPEKPQLTYETMNRDSAITLAEESIAAAPETLSAFVYISAADGSIVLPSRYLSTKREAEAVITTLSTSKKPFRPILLRPGFLYDSTRSLTLPLAGLMGVTSTVNSFFGGKLPLLGAAGYKPLKVGVVAEAAVEAIADESVKGVVEVKSIEELYSKAWRKGML
ncbi:NAD(P)-binding protein [Choiromyces venosus 120613-1]|uniref:NAD(P)-binding protein n=1 Tax=Choiromyces venosus 120613-1 TaxID=1336337 RepID=A0A3N4JXZ6_9PEZI|nr:NAD(P)-binding protein [Choiromyces venosus 120613-1]